MSVSSGELDEKVVPAKRASGYPLRWVALGVGLVAALIVGVFAAVQLGDAGLVDSPLIGKPAPTFDLPSIDGDERVRSADYAGRIYVVNFWASWCVPCREEAPNLQAFYERWSPRGVAVIGIVFNDTEDAAREFRSEFGLTYPQVMDPDFDAGLNFGITGIPETFVIDERGIVMAKLIGAVGPTTLDEVLQQIQAGETVTDRNDRYQQQR